MIFPCRGLRQTFQRNKEDIKAYAEQIILYRMSILWIMPELWERFGYRNTKHKGEFPAARERHKEVKKHRNVQEIHCINQEIERRVLDDMDKNDVLYICAPIGWGKYVLLSNLYDKLGEKAFWLEETEDSSLETQLEELSQLSGRRIIMIPRLEKLVQRGKLESISKLLSEKKNGDVFLITAEIPFPKKLLPYILYNKVTTYGRDDLKPSTRDVGEYFHKRGLKVDTDTLKQIEKDFDNMPLCIDMLENLLLDTNKKYSPIMREQCLEDVYFYLDTMVFHNFKVKEQEEILSLSCLEGFNEEEAAGMLDLSVKQVRELIQHLLDNGSVLQSCREGWQFEPLFERYLNRVRYKYLDTEEVRRMYRKALALAEEQKNWKACLRYSYLLDEEEATAGYLEKLLQGNVDFNVFLGLEGYFQILSPRSFMRYPMLMIAGSVLEAIDGNLKRSAEYEQMFTRYLMLVREPVEKEKLQRLLIYRRLIQIGAADIRELTELMTAIRSRADRASAWDGSDFQISQISILHGEKDYCDILAKEEYGSDTFAKLRTLTEGILDNAFYVMYSFAEAEVLYEQNRLEQAINMLSRTIWEAGTNRNPRMQQVCMIAVADLMVARNQLDNMDEFVAQKIEVTGQNVGLFADNVIAHQVYYYLLKNNQEKIMQWMQEKAPDWNFATIHYYQYLIKAKVYIWMGNYVFATVVLQKLLVFAENYGMHYLKMKVQILQAIVYFREENEDWVEMLIPALEYGEKIRFIRVFADEGVAVYGLLQELARKESAWAQKAYFKEVLSAVRAHMLQYPKYLKQQAVIDISDFSSYEKDIMKLLANGDKNSEIAQKLFVSENTVKYHLKNIYQKLEVKSRSQAVNKIKEFELL